jgi:hypothetical protein
MSEKQDGRPRQGDRPRRNLAPSIPRNPDGAQVVDLAVARRRRTSRAWLRRWEARGRIDCSTGQCACGGDA